MVSRNFQKGAHRLLVTLGMALLLIGVVLLTVSNQVFILGICFMGAGCLAVILYLLLTVSSCMRKSDRPQDTERQSETETRSTSQQQPQTETDSRQYEAPRYEDVIVCGSVWTVTLGPAPETEPPPYSALNRGRRGAIGEIRLPHPTLLRISSDIHEFKRSGGINGESWPEPLTPPPSYNEATRQWDDVFEPSQ